MEEMVQRKQKFEEENHSGEMKLEMRQIQTEFTDWWDDQDGSMEGNISQKYY